MIYRVTIIYYLTIHRIVQPQYNESLGSGERAWRPSERWPNEGLSEGYGHDGSGVCLSNGQTKAYLKDMGMTGLASV